MPFVWQKLHSKCYLDNYWFAKHQLDFALEVAAKYEKKADATNQDFAALAKAKESVGSLLRDRAPACEEWWKTKGRGHPGEEEWCKID